MSQLPFDPLLVAIAAPARGGAAIALGLPKRYSVKLAYAGFAVPALLALHCWYHFPADSARTTPSCPPTPRASTCSASA
jgi:NADH-quinone oxidoreductase subunit M